MKKYSILLLLVLASLLYPSKSQAAEDWDILSMDSRIQIQESGQVKVQETVKADFHDLSKHGIFRDIPYVYRTERGEELYTELEVESVTDGQTPIPFTESRSGSQIRLKIGDPDRTVTGKQTYVITYGLIGILKGFEGYDELYWNATGIWPVPIQEATATVILPQGGIIQASCYAGTYGSTVQCQTTAPVGGREARFKAPGPVLEGEQLTVAVGYTAGLVPLLTAEKPLYPFLHGISLPWVVGSFVLTLLVGIGILISTWRRHGRDQGKVSKVVAPEYLAPDGLRPAEIGVLLDERADTLDVSATIIDLATRGYLTITELEKKWLFGSVDYELKQAEKPNTDLMQYEKSLLSALFRSSPTIRLSALKNVFYTELALVKDALYDELTRKKLFRLNPHKVRSNYIVGGLVLFAVGMGLAVFSVSGKHSVGIGIGAAAAILGLLNLVSARAMPSRTAYGRELYQKALGYKMFVGATEKYRQPYFEKENIFMQVLPYAIVFGVTDKLAKAFESMGIQPPQPTWYSGHAPFNPVLFASHITTFSSSLGSAMASAPSSSGSGGGGFSGGGFGGGGGGSW